MTSHHPSSGGYEYHRLHHDELIAEAEARRLARRSRRNRPSARRPKWL